MAHALDFVHRISIDPVTLLRPLIIYGCALALIAAGAALPI